MTELELKVRKVKALVQIPRRHLRYVRLERLAYRIAFGRRALRERDEREAEIERSLLEGFNSAVHRIRGQG